MFPEFGTARRKPQRFQLDTLHFFIYLLFLGGGGRAKGGGKEESRPQPPPVTNDGQLLRAFAEIWRQVTNSFVMSARLSA
jgi:hypothetical protein